MLLDSSFLYSRGFFIRRYSDGDLNLRSRQLITAEFLWVLREKFGRGEKLLEGQSKLVHSMRARWLESDRLEHP